MPHLRSPVQRMLRRVLANARASRDGGSGKGQIVLGSDHGYLRRYVGLIGRLSGFVHVFSHL